MRWSPDTFWNATFHEVTSAYIGYCRSKGIGPFAKDKSGLTSADINRLKNWMEEEREQS